MSDDASEAGTEQRRREALDRWIGSVDVEPGEPFDIHRVREELADELLERHDEIAADFSRRAGGGEGGCGPSGP